MRATKTILLTAILALAFAVTAPALAGPQNGEVNHASGSVHFCVGTAPDPFWKEILSHRYVDLVIELLPLELLFPDAGDPSE